MRHLAAVDEAGVVMLFGILALELGFANWTECPLEVLELMTEVAKRRN